MRVTREELRSFAAKPAPLPPVVEPRLTPLDEVELLKRGTDPTVDRRRDRVRAILRRAAVPTGDDAELVVRLAVARLLPLEVREDRLRARQRLAGIANDPQRPAVVDEIVERQSKPPRDGSAFAELLLPMTRDLRGGFDPGLGGGGGGGNESGPGSVL